jgi:4a-hydroxytetrahydrobiopterin dehydratase
MTSDLIEKHCESCEGIGKALNADQIYKLLPQLNLNWQLSEDKQEIQRAFAFSNFYETMAFVNAIAFMAHQENHHPDIELGYNYCKLRYSTHALGGLSMNDFICAAKVDMILLG